MKYIVAYIVIAVLFSGCSLLQRDKGLCECECSANCLDLDSESDL